MPRSVAREINTYCVRRSAVLAVYR